METAFTRIEWLVGKDNVERLHKKSVAVFGCGGVGSFAIEALVRSGIGRIVIIDGDEVTISNLNRQLIATLDTVGQRKVEVTKNRILSIRSDIQVEAYDMVYTGESHPDFIASLNVDYVIDCIDMVSAKLSIIETCQQLSIPCISSMGTGNKLFPDQLTITDIHKTHTCPLAKVMRKELRKRGIRKQTVIYSTEEPRKPIKEPGDTSRSPGSCGFVPSVAGLQLAGYVLRQLMEV